MVSIDCAAPKSVWQDQTAEPVQPEAKRAPSLFLFKSVYIAKANYAALSQEKIYSFVQLTAAIGQYVCIPSSLIVRSTSRAPITPNTPSKRPPTTKQHQLQVQCFIS